MDITLHTGGGSIGIDIKILLAFALTTLIFARPHELLHRTLGVFIRSLEDASSFRGSLAVWVVAAILLMCSYVVVWCIFTHFIISVSLFALFASECEVTKQAQPS